MINISEELKQKIINGDYISQDEIDLFFEYVSCKSNIILEYMKEVKDYSRINLCNEMFWSYNLESDLLNVNNHYFCIVNINNIKYIFDISFKDKRISELSKKGYIELEGNYKEYIKILEEGNE